MSTYETVLLYAFFLGMPIAAILAVAIQAIILHNREKGENNDK